MQEHTTQPKTLHISSILEEELIERGWDRNELAWRMQPEATTKQWQVNRLVLDFLFDLECSNLLIGEKTANQLALAFDIDADFFLNLHNGWRQANSPCANACCVKKVSNG